jgi:nucleotidyltransferase/DNA polymerase involved in DNA repair
MFATIYPPDFYLQAVLRHRPELQGKPVAVIDDQEKKAVIVQLNPVAEPNLTFS